MIAQPISHIKINSFCDNEQIFNMKYYNLIANRIVTSLLDYNFIPLLLFGCIGWRIDCRNLSYCSLNHWLRGILFAVKVSRLSLSRKICKGVLSVANHRLCSEENSRPVKFTILPLISSANSIAESPICLARRSNLRR